MQFIVAEVTKNYNQSDSHDLNDIISTRFQYVINANLKRGYKLIDWKFASVLTRETILTETIVAVFEKIEP